MKAFVFRAKGDAALEERPMPEIASPKDAIVKLAKTTICGTDLHIMKGDVPSVASGRVLGHEGLGTIERVGPGVSAFKPGDRVIIMCITSCATCSLCKRGTYSHCADGGWMLGRLIDGTQAEYVRVPHADTSLHKVPEGVDERALVMISDVFPTALECGVVSGKVQPASTLAIVGVGPVGLAAVITAQLYSPMQIIVIARDLNRLKTALSLGATHAVQFGPDMVDRVMELTHGKGVDTAIEAAGVPATFKLCQDIIGVGGTIANIGVYGTKVDLHFDRLWDRNISITTQLVDTTTAPTLIKLIEAGKINPTSLITHTFPFAKIDEAYAVFATAAQNKVVKVIIDFE